MMKTMLTALAALALAAPALAAAPTAPDTALAKDHVTLDLRGLDLATAKGQSLLAIRVDQAARAVCGDKVATIHLDLDAQARACRADVTADIRSRIEARTAAVATPTRLAMR